MLEFKEIKISDKPWVKELLSYSDFRGCEYTFGNNFVWSKPFNNKIARYKDFYILESEGELVFPAGRGDIRELIIELKKYSEQQGRGLYFSSSSKQTAQLISEIYGDAVEIRTNPDFYDYCYNFEDLATLVGKKFHSKRNFINRFKTNNWSYEPITRENINLCTDMSHLWINENVPDTSLKQEILALEAGLEHFFELDFIGGLLRVDGDVVAFTYGEKLNSDTFNVHVEKALDGFVGAYPMINAEFVQRNCKNFNFINREEDMGEQNLRKAKLSYHPAFMEKKFQILFK